jgi:hypothetical protein
VILRLLAAVALSACQADPPRKPTYYRDVAPLLASNCQECHQPAGIVPVPPIVDYSSVVSYAQPIVMATQLREMPPWAADNSGACGTWDGARWLSDAEISTLATWVTDGEPEGTPDAVSAATPMMTPFAPAVALDIGGVYQPGLGAGGSRCFLVDPQLDQDHLLTAIRVISDDPRAVAQLTLFALDSPDAEAQAAALDAAESGLGYSCFGTTRTTDSRLVASWTWPAPILRLPAGTGVRLSAGRQMVIQIHYDIAYTSTAFASDTQVELELDDQVAEAHVLPLAANGPLAPGLASVQVDARQVVDQSIRVVGVAPRMHNRGKTMTVAVENNGTTCLATFPAWHFNDQQLFRASHPVAVPSGSNLHITCDFDTEGRTDPVAFGDSTDDEECTAYLFVTN